MMSMARVQVVLKGVCDGGGLTSFEASSGNVKGLSAQLLIYIYI